MYAEINLPMSLAGLSDSISHLVKILVLAITITRCHSSFHLSLCFWAICHPIYLPYFANSSSALVLSISSSLKQIATAISPSSVLGIKYIKLSTG